MGVINALLQVCLNHQINRQCTLDNAKMFRMSFNMVCQNDTAHRLRLFETDGNYCGDSVI